jgi:predicted AAA+ superfamily ATPase
MTGKKRNLEKKLIKLLELFPVVVILGTRQCGKTTLAKTVGTNWKYIDLENPDDFERLSRDPIFFFKQFPQHIIFDEAQAYPDLFNILRGVVDADRALKGRFILTGSASPELYKIATDTLAGRIAIIELGTFKVNEFTGAPLSEFYLNFEKKLDKNTLQTGKPSLLTKDVHHIWLNGGYPEPTLSQDAQFISLWFDNYRKTYIDRDIAVLFPKLKLPIYQRFLNILSKLSATIINKSELSRALEIDEKTVREYLTIASGTFFWRQLPSYEKDILKSVIKMPKGYIRDSGILHYLLKIDSLENLYNHPIIGQSFESFVIEEIIKGLSATLVTNWQAHYYRTRAGAEIDLILDGPFGVLPIEIKYGSKVTGKQIQSLTAFVQEHNLPYGLVINQAGEAEWLNDFVFQLPVNYI